MQADTARSQARVRWLRAVLNATILRAIAAALPRPPVTALPLSGSEPHRVLFVRYERIGDMIMATSLIRAIARAHPAIHLDVLASRANAPVLDGNPHVGQVIVFDRSGPVEYYRVLRQIGHGRYDTIVDGRINTPRVFFTTPLLMLFSRAPHRVGMYDPGDAGAEFYNVGVRAAFKDDGDCHYIDAAARLAEPFGVDRAAVDWRPEIFLTTGERAAAEAQWRDAPRGPDRPRFLVNLSAPPGRRWPDERFIGLIRAARERHPALTVAVLGVPAEEASIHAVAQATGAIALHAPTVRSAFAAVDSADCVFTPDTSIAHAASAFCKPTVVMLHRGCSAYPPYRTPGSVLLWEGSDIAAIRTAKAVDAVLAMTATLTSSGAYPPAS